MTTFTAEATYLSLLDVSGARNVLYYDPEDNSAYVFSYVGNSSWPMEAHNNIHVCIGNVDAKTSEESLQEWCQAHADSFDALGECYMGTEWDGSNHVGSWTEDRESIEQSLSDALDEADLPTYWDAEEWMHGDWRGVCLGALASGDLDAFCDEMEDDAAQDGHLVDSGDMFDVLQKHFESEIKETESEDPNDISDKEWKDYLAKCKLVGHEPMQRAKAQDEYKLTVEKTEEDRVLVRDGYNPWFWVDADGLDQYVWVRSPDDDKDLTIGQGEYATWCNYNNADEAE